MEEDIGFKEIEYSEEIKEVEEKSEEKDKEMWQEGEPEKIVESSRNIVWLSEVGRKDVNIAGGKGANLAEMYNIDLPVPPAFVITAQAYQNFLRQAKIKDKIIEIANSIELENTQQLEERTKEIRELIVKSEMPEELKKKITEAYSNINVDRAALEEASADALVIIRAAKEPCFVAVRSSATTEDLSTASFAGQQETFVNIKGNKELIEAVKKCWASLFTARATYYRARKGFAHEKSFIAVIVQKMVNSEKSGVTFTINPLTNNEDEIIIEAVFGLGEETSTGSTVRFANASGAYFGGIEINI